MRLIDADDLDITTITTDDYSGNEVLDVVLKEDIENAPTVNAIPIPDGATNGDMIKAMFPKDYIKIYDRSVSSWWNAPYKGGE